MDELAPSISELLGLGAFDLVSTRRGNLNYSFVLEAPGGPRLFVKQFGSRIERKNARYRARGERYQVEKAALDACQRRHLPAPKLLAHDDELLLLVEEYVQGEDLFDYLSAGGDADSMLYGLGLWLGCFHSFFQGQAPSATLAEEGWRHVRRWQRMEDNDQPGLQEELQRLLSRLEAFPAEEAVLCRNDCHLGNFLVRDQELVGIDFEMCAFGPPGLEIASLYLSFLRWRYRGALPESLSAASGALGLAVPMLEGYVDANRGELPAPFGAYLAVKLLKFMARWPPKAGSYLQAALTLIDACAV